jgi:nitroimidazol reductase NimA-like FMN-containing flavoprotein (pyridoxamine 5'-phosphate oxidase superfamily)
MSRPEAAMIGTLTPQEIEQVLTTEILGRIAFIIEGRPTVVPITYAYDGEAIYVHSAEGEKLHAMQVNPTVCFEVEQIEDMANWRSVVAHGTFERLQDDPEGAVMEMLVQRFAPLRVSETAAPDRRREQAHRRGGVTRPALFRILLTDKAGRFERS